MTPGSTLPVRGRGHGTQTETLTFSSRISPVSVIALVMHSKAFSDSIIRI